MTRPWRIIAGLALILAASSVLLTAVLVRRIQTERVRSLTVSCLRDSAQSAANLKFLAAVSPQIVDEARRYYHVYSPAECHRAGGPARRPAARQRADPVRSMCGITCRPTPCARHGAYAPVTP
jgi:hypothetical protein